MVGSSIRRFNNSINYNGYGGRTDCNHVGRTGSLVLPLILHVMAGSRFLGLDADACDVDVVCCCARLKGNKLSSSKSSKVRGGNKIF